jgi:Uma2 family endonuclease
MAQVLDIPIIRLPVRVATLDGFRAWALSDDRPWYVRAGYANGQIHLEIYDGGPMIHIPTSATTLDGFRAWVTSDQCPKRWRFSFTGKEILIDMSPEELETHAKVKAVLSAAMHNLVEELDIGEFFPDGSELTLPSGQSYVPDATVVTWEISESGRVQYVPRKGKRGHYVELHGTPDWVLEVVSQSSVLNDTRDKRRDYHQAGIPEYWLIDARGADIDFQILIHRRKGYVVSRPRGGWHPSPLFGRRFRLERTRNRVGRWQYHLYVQTA